MDEIIEKSLSGSTESQTAASVSRLTHREGLEPLLLSPRRLRISEASTTAGEQSAAMQSLLLFLLSH